MYSLKTELKVTKDRLEGPHNLLIMCHNIQILSHATQAACAGNTRGYHSEYGNSWFNNRENDDAYYMFRSYNNCYYSSSEPVTDQEDEL